MKKTLMLFVAVLSLAIMSGCGPSFKEYVGMSSTYTDSITNHTTVSVTIEPNNVVHEGPGIFGTIGAVVNTASAIGGAVVEQQQEARLQQLIYSDDVSNLVANGFNDGFVQATHLQFVDVSANPDLRINLTVRKYGLWAENVLSAMNFYVDCDVEVIYTPELRRIYRNNVIVQREVANVFSEISSNVHVEVSGGGRDAHIAMGAINDTARLVNGAANLTAFFELTDEQIQQIFAYMAYDAGLYVAEQLKYAIYR
ncbi:MAG: hypothetical protein IJU23_00055 [Proteobacteria bacterium]|nr:hypothetical protein [Pseudomonadota bacterium]